MKYTQEDGTPFTKEEFLKKLETDNEFNEEFGNKGIDQISDLITQLKENPNSRRLMVSAWNSSDLQYQVLPPCHYGFQIYTRELSLNERIDLVPPIPNLFTHEDCNTINLPKRAISLMWNQRSVDTLLGLPFNIASYGLLLEIIAKLVNMVPDELIGNLGDTHLYSNHIEQAKEQIGRKYNTDERNEILKEVMGDKLYHQTVEELIPFGGGLSEYYDLHKIPYHTKEPFKLPKLNINTEFWLTENGECGFGGISVGGFIKGLNDNNFIRCLLENDIQLYDYQSHSPIKAPLSN